MVGLWSCDYQAVVGVVGQAHANGDGRAITLHQADLCLPGLKLAALVSWSVEAAGEVALTQWGWTLARDPEGIRHWRPRARGVSIESERGWRFRGRTAALRAIVSWLDRATPDRRVLVITGSPGVGKSAVLGRIVTTADADILASLPHGDGAVRASVGSVGCAVHAKGKTALEVAEEIARAASAALPREPEDLAPAIRDAVGERSGTRFNVIIDALDEAAGHSQARAIIERIALPLAETCSDVGVQVIVGTRRRDDGGDLLAKFCSGRVIIDLDNPGYFAEEDLAAYALACLQLAGDERSDNPYADDALAEPLAARIAEMSGQNFLIAGLIGRSHGMHDERAAKPTQLQFAATVDSALATYLQGLNPVAGLPAAQALTALAFAEAPGFPAALWKLAVEAIYRTRVSIEDLTRFARSSAANFLVETGGDTISDVRGADVGPVYRLFHQALNDALLHSQAEITPRASDERALTEAFMRHGQQSNWKKVSGYLLRSLPSHAQAAGLVDELLSDHDYLLHADLRRVIQAAEHANSVEGCSRARLLQLTPRAITAFPDERAALFSIGEALDDLGAAYRSGSYEAPYKARWAAVRPRTERIVLEGHHDWVNAVCAVAVEGRDLLVSASEDRTVRIWDPQTGEERVVLRGHQGGVSAGCAVTVEGQELLATTGDDSTVRIWDPQTGENRVVLRGHEGWVTAVCAVAVEGRDLVASAGYDGTVRIWDPAAHRPRAVLEAHYSGVTAVCAVTVEGRELLATGGRDGTVRIWDPVIGHAARHHGGHQGAISAVSVVTVEGRDLVASSGYDGTVRIWDPQTGEERVVLRGHQGSVSAVSVVTVEGRDLVASSGYDGTVRIWDPQAGEERVVLRGHQGWVTAVCAVTVEGRELLAASGRDGTVRVWDPAADRPRAVLETPYSGVTAVCAVTVEGRELLAASGRDGITRTWDPATGKPLVAMKDRQGWATAMCAVTVEGRELLAADDRDGTLGLWDLQTGERRTAMKGPRFGIRANVCDHHKGATTACQRGR